MLSTKPEELKGHIQPQYGEHGTQQPHGHSIQLAHRSRLESPRRGKGEVGMGQQLPLQNLPARLRAALTVCPAVLNSCQAWNTFLPGTDPRSSPNEEKKASTKHTQGCATGENMGCPFSPAVFPSTPSPGALGFKHKPHRQKRSPR